MTESRQWRIMRADDFSAHLNDAVFNLCWSRGYVFIPHGGGVTPVVQGPDTDLNQHVRRRYTAREAAEFIQQMRDGIHVPRRSEEESIAIMVGVLDDEQLHLVAADPFI